MARVSLVLAVVLLLTGAVSAWLIYRTESASWVGRQGEAARTAATAVADFVQRSEDTLVILSLFGHDELAANSEGLTRLLELNPAFEELVFVDPQGHILSSVARGRAILANLVTIAQARWFQAAARGELYLGDVQVSAANEPYMIVAMRSARGYVVAGRLRMDMLWDVVKDIRFGQSGRVFVADSDGRVVAHTDLAVVLAQTDLRNQTELLDALRNSQREWRGAYQSFDGAHVMVATAPVSRTDWVVVAELPRYEAFASTRSAVVLLTVGFVLFGVAAIGMIRGFIHSVVLRPITELQAGISYVGAGNLDYRIENARRDELGKLSEAFNTMTARLEESYQGLTRSNAELAQFAFIASHDLQEPLRMVTTYLQLLQRRYGHLLTGDAQEFMGFAFDGAMRMSRLIKDLLEYSRVGSRGEPFRQVDFEEALSITLANLDVQIQESAAVVTHDPLPVLMADLTQVIQLLQNLIGNALKYRNERPPQIHVAALRCDPAQGGKTRHWQFSVRDNGIGIAPEYYERIFLIFQRLHSREQYSGTGIGLAVCRRIVERHGGRIWVESTPGQGSTFYFTLPDGNGSAAQH